MSTSARIYNGALSLLLVPSTTAPGGSNYLVIYHSSDGTVTWTESWAVPPSTTAVSEVSTVCACLQPPGRASGSDDAGSGTGGTTGGAQYATLPITIAQVTGLGSSLVSLTSANT